MHVRDDDIFGILARFESDEPLSDDMRDISIFSMGCMSILIAYLDSSLKIKSMSMILWTCGGFSIFSSAYF
jgi:hypothetical protein